MEAEGIAPSAISAFESSFQSLVSGDSGMISESSISPVDELVSTTSITGAADASLLGKTVICKLNGGLGTGMGLDKAKSLLKVKGDDTFLDLTAKQIVSMRESYGLNVKFMLMNSFSTSKDTLDFFKERYPIIASEDGLEMLQNKVPKLDATTFEVSCWYFLFLLFSQ
jgi:UDP-N-acetylglucosamine pyrophosphorylase